MNRSKFILDQLKFYAKHSFQHQILVGDSSSLKEHQDNLKKIEYEFSDKLDLSFYHFPQKTNREVNLLLASKAREKYCSFIGDDDYFVADGLDKCVLFLDKNKSYRTAQGSSLLFLKNDRRFYWSWYWRNVGSEKETALERFSQHSFEYWVPIFSVHRVDEFLEDISHLQTIDKSFDLELIQSFNMVSKGKSKFIDMPYLIRQAHPTRLVTLSGIEWITSEGWFESFETFCDVLAFSISKIDGIPILESKKLVQDLFKMGYLDLQLEKQYTIATKLDHLILLKSLMKKIINFFRIFGFDTQIHKLICKKRFGKKWLLIIDEIESNYSVYDSKF